MRVLVTGAAGFLGRAVVEELLSAGMDVTPMVRRAPESWRVHFGAPVAADITDVRSVRRLVVGGGFDAIVHLAGLKRGRESLGQPLRYFDVNVGGTLHLLRCLEEVYEGTGKWIRVVFASSSVVYGSPQTRDPLTEERPLSATSPYAATKISCEQMLSFEAKTGALGAVILRLFNVAGAAAGHSDPDLTRIIPGAIAVANGSGGSFPLNGDGSAVREFVHVLDVARAFRVALEEVRQGENLVLNVGSGIGLTMREVIATVERASGCSLAVDVRPPQDEPAFLVADVSRARAQLGWEPVHSGIDEIVGDAWRAVRLGSGAVGRGH